LLSIFALLVLAASYLHYASDVAYEPSARGAEITYGFTVGDIPPGARSVLVWVPVPLSNNRQKLQSITVRPDEAYEVIGEDEYGNKFLLFDLSRRTSGAAAISVRFRVVRDAFFPLRKAASAERSVQANLVGYLAPARLIPIGGKIAEEARRVVGHERDKLRQSRLLYDNIVSTMTYDKSGVGWGRGDAVYACDVRKGNCTDFHSLFIGQARALKIPARFIMGLPLPEDKKKGKIDGYHCWSEFYIPEKGWLPIDASEASRFPKKKELLFGGLDQHRVAFTIGRDIKLPRSAARPLNYAIFPHVEIDGLVHPYVETTFSFRDYRID
jgi:transglutaminase-like putative cysteine protease